MQILFQRSLARKSVKLAIILLFCSALSAFLVTPDKAAATAEARLIVCDSYYGLPNLPMTNANNTNYIGVSSPNTDVWNFLGRKPATNNWIGGTASDDTTSVARYPGVQIGAGPWTNQHAYQNLNNGDGSSPYYANLFNACNSSGGWLSAGTVRNTFTKTTEAMGGDTNRLSIRINAPWGDVRNDVVVNNNCVTTDCGSKVGFARIITDERIRTDLNNLNQTNSSDGRWQGAVKVFNPISDGFSWTGYFGDDSYIGCYAYQQTSFCNGNDVVTGPTPTAFDSVSTNPKWPGQSLNANYLETGLDAPPFYKGTDGKLMTATWKNGYIGGTRNPDHNSNPTLAPRRSFTADLYCNMSNFVYCDSGSSSRSVAIRNFDAILTDNEKPLSNLGTVGQSTSSPVVSHWPEFKYCNSGVCGIPITTGQQVPEAFWINKSKIAGNKTLRFNAMDAGFGIVDARLSINGSYAPTGGSQAAATENWSSQCTNYSGGGSQYRLDRAFEVPRTGTNALKMGSLLSTPRYTINASPICATSMTYNRYNVNLQAAPFQEGQNTATIDLTDFTRAGAGTANTNTENHMIRIDTVAPVVDDNKFGLQGFCYKAATGLTDCNTVQINGAAGTNYIRGSTDMAFEAYDQVGTLGSGDSSHSGLSLQAANVFIVNGAGAKACSVPPVSGANIYQRATYASCAASGSSTFNTLSYSNGAELVFAVGITDRAENGTMAASKPFVIDNAAPLNYSKALNNSTIELTATDIHSGVREIQAVAQASQPSDSLSWTTPGTVYSNGATANFPANSIVWVRVRDNLVNTSSWKRFDLTAPEATVYCDQTGINNTNGWVKNQNIPCWIEASKQDTGTIQTVAMRYKPAAAANDAWTGTTNCTSNYSNDNNCYVWGGPGRSGDGNVVGNEGYSGTGPYASFYFNPVVHSGSDMTAGIMQTNGGYIGNNYELIVQAQGAANSPYNTWGDWIWNANIPYNQRLATPRTNGLANFLSLDSSGRPSNVTLIASAYARKTANNNWLFLPSGETTGKIGLAFVNTVGAQIPGSTDYTQMSTAQTSGVWQKIQSKITIPIAQAGSGFGLVPSSSAKPNNASPLSGITSIDSLRLSPQFLVPAGIQGVTYLQGMATQGSQNSANDNYELKKDATSPALTDQLALAPETGNSNPSIKGELLEHEGEQKYAGYMRLGIRARDLFVGNPSYVPNNFSIETSEKTAANAIRTAYNNISSSVRNGWAQESSGMASGAWIACSYADQGSDCDNIPTDNRIDPSTNEIIGSDGRSRWFFIDQSNTGVDGACSGTLFNNSGNSEWYSCVFNVGLAPFKSDQRYAIRFRAEDQAGNVSYSSPQTFTTHPKCLAIIGVASP